MALRSKTAKDSKTKNNKPEAGFFKRWKGGWVLFFVVLTALVISGSVVWFVGFYVPGQLFSGNKHFILKQVRINSPTLQQNEAELMKELDIRYGEPLFSLDLSKIRKKLLKINPNYNPQVYLRLPDTLEIKVVESSPVMRINDPASVKKNGKLQKNKTFDAVDENGNPINLSRLGLAHIHLPLLSGLPSGGKFDKSLVMPALRMLDVVKSRYPDIEIREISVQKKNILEFVFIWRRQHTFKALFAADDPNFVERVNALQNAILDEGRNNSNKNSFNLCEPGKIYASFEKI